ncbi:MAG: hypothetical protein A3D10_03115 [Omnitrophica WOR_2 bacterium RIFCSPHIGHO2_02_FULL_48_11]|nr:MAG: hypothetical protein A3D10_03115 [Omnitrophica WOR_2 bacterium RIFCSPHIGHO2_02_FULL_48_11]
MLHDRFYTASDHVKAIVEHTNSKIINTCILNVAEAPAEALERYKNESSFPVAPDVDKIKEMGYKAVATDLLGVDNYVRHNSEKLTRALIKVIETHRVIKR